MFRHGIWVAALVQIQVGWSSPTLLMRPFLNQLEHLGGEISYFATSSLQEMFASYASHST
jgi:hypothetical protein